MADYAKGKSKGTIKSIVSGGNPWTSTQGGVFYPFDVEIDSNGSSVKGQMNFKSAEAKYVVGDMIVYDVTTPDTKGRIKIQNHAKADDNTGPSGKPSTYNDPLSVKHTGMSMAQMCVNDMFIQLNKGKEKLREMLTAESTPEEIAAAQDKWPRSNKQFDAYAMKFYLWIINGVEPLVRDTVTNKGYCVQRAISQMSYKNFLFDEEANKADTTKGVDINSSDDILKQAEHLFLQQQILT
jgi:hypothetical protein